MDCFTGFWPLDWKRTLKVNNYVPMTFDHFMSHISGEASPYSETKFMELPTSFLLITQSSWDWRLTLS